jgi:hypothetical protein
MEQNWREAMIVFNDEFGDAPQLSRSERLTVQRAASEKHRCELIDRLTKAGLAREVEVPKATPLTSLLVKGSPRALAEIDKVPSVKRVMPISAQATLGVVGE